jgi:hypothetical protein
MNHQYFGLDHLFMGILGMMYFCLTNIRGKNKCGHVAFL